VENNSSPQFAIETWMARLR